MKFLESGRKLPPLTTHEERLLRLKDRDYILSEAHQAQLWRISQMDVHDEIKAFVRVMVDNASRHGVPVYCASVDGEHVTIHHAQYEDRLNDDDWVCIGQIGNEVIETCLIRAYWCGAAGGNPALWHVDTWRFYDKLKQAHA